MYLHKAAQILSPYVHGAECDGIVMGMC